MSAKFTIEGSGAGAIKVVEQTNAALDKTEKTAERAAKAAAKLEEQLGKQAQRIKETINPQEKLNRLQQELKGHVEAGRLTIEQADKATEHYRQTVLSASETGNKGFRQNIATIVDLTRVVDLLSQSFQKAEQKAQGAADAVLNSLGSAGEMQQMGAENFARHAATARALVRSGAVGPGNLGQAFDIATNLANAGFNEGETRFLVEQVAGQRIVSAQNLEPLGGALRKMQNAFNNQAGTLPQVMDKVLVAAGETQANATQTTTEVLKFAGLAANAGVSADQALAAFVGVEQRSPNAEAAAERLKSLFTQVNARQLAKGDLFGTLGNIEGLVGKAGGNAFKVLGDSNAVLGYLDLLKSRPVVEAQARAIAGSGGALQSRIGALNIDPSLAAAAARSSEEGGLAVAEESLLAARENLFDASRAAFRRRDISQGRSAPFQWATGVFESVIDALGMENTMIENAARMGRQEPGFFSDPETQKRIEAYLSQIASGIDTVKTQQRSTVTTRQE